jgi:hypothetical protein
MDSDITKALAVGAEYERLSDEAWARGEVEAARLISSVRSLQGSTIFAPSAIYGTGWESSI